ncbi:MAG: glycosyltransferase family 2 protein, partial [Anaerolineae bacterium]|nr:glycosyltransferase family 2 protein [Anaerolineae bacterium]
MSDPIVSVIIPTYGGANYLAEAIQSVLNQTYPNFELIVVNDASPDDTHQLMEQFDDERLNYIVHKENQGAVAARETGLQASSGDLIAFLDQDDLFHPEKLEAYVAFMGEYPEIGVSYNGRFEINAITNAIREIWQPPLSVTLEDMIVGFPFAPSDTVFRRKWVFNEGIWDYNVGKGDEVVVNGGEYVYCGRLYFAGCKFAGIDRALNYRRYHPNRVYSDLEQRCESEHYCQEIILTDPRCPADVQSVRDTAHMNTNLVWAYYAFAQEETKLGQKFLNHAIQL